MLTQKWLSNVFLSYILLPLVKFILSHDFVIVLCFKTNKLKTTQLLHAKSIIYSQGKEGKVCVIIITINYHVFTLKENMS